MANAVQHPWLLRFHRTAHSECNGDRVRTVSNIAYEIAYDLAWQTLPLNPRCFMQHLWEPRQKGLDVSLALPSVTKNQAWSLIEGFCSLLRYILSFGRSRCYLPLPSIFLRLLRLLPCLSLHTFDPIERLCIVHPDNSCFLIRQEFSFSRTLGSLPLLSGLHR